MSYFYKTTPSATYIKYLLMNTPIPNCSFMQEGDFIIEGGVYLFKNKIYRCTASGVFYDKGTTDVMSPLYCAERVLCRDDAQFTVTDDDVPYGGAMPAEVEIVCGIKEGDTVDGLTEYFVSTKAGYDWETHKVLGDYLRMLRSIYSLDLMPLYNCYCDRWVDDVDLSNDKLSSTLNSGYKTTLVPVKFNHTYTVALNSLLPIKMMPVIYNNGLVKRISDGEFLYSYYYPRVYTYYSASSHSPLTVEIPNSVGELQSHERDLYLAIQIPNSVSTDIVVIEGKASPFRQAVEYDIKALDVNVGANVNNLFKSGCRLLYDNKPLIKADNVPYSDKLIEYLLRHTIDTRDTFTTNIQKVSDVVDGGRVRYFWDLRLRAAVYHKYIKACEKNTELDSLDVFGYVDSEVEKAMSRGYM